MQTKDRITLIEVVLSRLLLDNHVAKNDLEELLKKEIKKQQMVDNYKHYFKK